MGREIRMSTDKEFEHAQACKTITEMWEYLDSNMTHLEFQILWVTPVDDAPFAKVCRWQIRIFWIPLNYYQNIIHPRIQDFIRKLELPWKEFILHQVLAETLNCPVPGVAEKGSTIIVLSIIIPVSFVISLAGLTLQQLSGLLPEPIVQEVFRVSAEI